MLYRGLSRLKVAVVVKSYAVELFKGVCYFAVGRGEAGIQGNALHLGRVLFANVNACAFFDIAEVNCLISAALVRDHGRFHMAN